MIYEYMAGLLLTLSTPAGACRCNTVLHFLLSTINTEAFHSNTYYPFLSLPPVIILPPSLPTIALSNQRQAKYTENKLKAIKARNEYLLALEATNNCVFKYYIHDLADIIDVSITTQFAFVGAANIYSHACENPSVPAFVPGGPLGFSHLLQCCCGSLWVV